MTDPNTPPPIPPPVPPVPPAPQRTPPAPRKPFPWLALLAGLCLLCVVLGIAGFFGLKSLFENVENKVVTSPPNAGKPTILTTEKDDWIKASFPEVPTSISLPAPPDFVPLDPAAFDTYMKLLADKYAEYEVDGEKAFVHVNFYWLNMMGNMMTGPTEIHDFAQSYVEDWATEGKPEHVDLAEKPSGSTTYKYRYVDDAGENNQTRTAFYFFKPFPGGVMVIGVHADKDADGLPTVERIAASLK